MSGSATKPNNKYAVCIQTSDLLDETDSIAKTRLLVGDLVQIQKIHNFDRCIIQLFDRKSQTFQSALYRCEKENVCEISNTVWQFIHRITEGSLVKVRMSLTDEQQVNVNFQVKFFYEIPPGGDQFYGLQLMPTPNLSIEHMTELYRTYSCSTISLIILRADNLILNLVFDEDETPNRNKTPHDFVLGDSSDVKLNVIQTKEELTIPADIRQKVKSRTPNLCNKQSSNGSTLPNLKQFILPKVIENENSCNLERNCFSCGKREETLIQLNCQHIFCSECLVFALNDHALNDQYCPYTTQDYNCRYKITMEDLLNILNIANGKLIEKRDLSKPKPLFHKCTDCQSITKTNEQNSDECTNCKSLKLQNDIDCKETPSREPPNKIVPAIETWTCIYCTYNENCIGTIQCVVCEKTNNELVRDISKNTEYFKLLELEEIDTFMPNSNIFVCPFCDQTILPDNGVTLRSCLHNICFKCIVSYIERQDQIEIECPHIMCKHLLEVCEIKSFITPEAYDELLEKSLNIGKNTIENGYQCCVIGCKGFWIFDDVNVKYACPICKTENCIACKASHPGIVCSVFKAQPKT